MIGFLKFELYGLSVYLCRSIRPETCEQHAQQPRPKQVGEGIETREAKKALWMVVAHVNSNNLFGYHEN